MRVKEFILSETHAQKWGLCPINMNRLGRIVALAGKNGSGKSRILDALLYANGERNHALLNRRTDAKNKEFYETVAKASSDPETIDKWRQAVLEGDERKCWLNRVRVDSDNELHAIRFIPKRLELDDPLALSARQLLDRFEEARKLDTVENMAAACLGYIQQCQNRYWHVTHQNYHGDAGERQTHIDDYNSLQLGLSSFLGVELSRSDDGCAQIFGRNIFEAKLSDGQKILLQLAVALHARTIGVPSSVFILDEPENHLHPSVAIDVLEKIFEIAPDSQVWLATHSVPLLSYVVSKDPMALWYVNDGSIAHAGRNPGYVLESLLGGDDRIAQLHAFTGLPSQLAAVNYAAESLISPVVVPFSGADPQINQIRKMLARTSNGNPVKILDFGAGKGRLLEGLAALEIEDLKSKIDYFAFDSSCQDAEICKLTLTQLYGDDRARHFSTMDQILNELSSSFFDVVVMCNVLHEISPVEWSGLFSEGSALNRAISSNGYLLVVEDLRIPTGEKAHECGFLVLDTQHLKTLFGVLDEDVRDGRFISSDARGDGRLKAHLISKGLLGRMNVQTRTQAIAGLADTSYREIQALRNKPAVYSNGMLHGFWTQQFANAAIYLRTVQ